MIDYIFETKQDPLEFPFFFNANAMYYVEAGLDMFTVSKV